MSNFKGQLADASDDAVQVAAELLYVHTLVASTTAWSARKKAELVNTVAGIGGPGVISMSDDLATVLAGGAAGTGQAYLNYRPRMFTYLVRVFRTVKALSRAERREAVSSLEAWRSAVAEVETQSVWSQVYAGTSIVPGCRTSNSEPQRSGIDRCRLPGSWRGHRDGVRHARPECHLWNRSFVDPYWFPLRQFWTLTRPRCCTRIGRCRLLPLSTWTNVSVTTRSIDDP